MDMRTHLKALWVEFSKAFVEDCRYYFMPWRQIRRIRDLYKNK